MLEGLLHLISPRPISQILIDILDLLVVTYVVYRALLVLRGTRAMQMGTGLGVIFLVYVVSKWAGFITLFNLLQTLLSSIILIVVVVFQNDIRRGLMRVGARAFLGGISRQQESRVIDEVVAAATELARHRTGALICFEQDANLDEFVVGQGTILDAVVQRELLVTLFYPDTSNKLHDGAVVIRNLRIAKAGVFFPMPDTKVVDKSLGSRHRAALGITEETDAVVVVVSEERGTISFCHNGNIVLNMDGASLRQALLGLFGQRSRKKKSGSKESTGAFRITLPPPTAPGASLPHPTPAPTPVAAPADKTGAIILAPAKTGSIILSPVLRTEPLSRVEPPPPRPLPTVSQKTIDTPISRGITPGDTASPRPPSMPPPPAAPVAPDADET